MPCPYQEVCKCPGGSDYEPVEGVQAQEEGVKCLDFPDILLSYRMAFPVRKMPGGRHIVDAVESMEKLEAAQRKYSRSEKGKDTRRRWKDSKKGQTSIKSYQETEKYKLSQQKYRESAKGQKAVRGHEDRNKLFRIVNRWMKENPGKTAEDYFKEHPRKKGGKK